MTEIDNKEYFQIGEVSKKLGITPRTIRYYEELGLLDPPLRIEKGIRLYSKEDIKRIKFILKLKELGLTLKEMLELADIYNQHKQPLNIMPKLIEILDNHIIKIDEKIARLASLRKDIVEYRQRIMKIIEEGRLDAEKEAKNG